jgi:uncharacterized membrane protein
MTKSATFGAMHVGIAFGVSYALTGNVTIAGAITVVEPLVNTVAHYFFDKAWESGRVRAPWAKNRDVRVVMTACPRQALEPAA